jgi:hypothetical protein
MFNKIDESSNKPAFIRNANSIVELISGEFCENIHRIWNDFSMDYLAASDLRRHVWHSWLSKKADLETEPSFLDFLSFAKSRDIIKDGFGSCPAGFLPALKKLGPSAEGAAFYLGLFELFCKGGQVSKLLQHSEKLDHEIISNLTGIPDDEFSGQVLSRLIQRTVDPDRFSGAVWIAQLLREALGELAVIDTLNKTYNPLAALRRMLAQLDFPPAPFEFNGPLVAITSANDLRVIAHEFKNCLREKEEFVDITLSIQTGRQCLYRWYGTEPALVQFGRFGQRGWLIEDAKGPSNARLSRDTQQEIVGLLAQYPTICPAWPNRQALPSFIWFYF